MTPERWARLEEIYQGAAAVDVESRAAFLQDACAGDDALLHELDSLLACHDKAGSFIEQPAFFVSGNDWLSAEDAGEEDAAAFVGRRIGSYELVRLIGTGGMGSVYLALRADDQYRQQVALKVIKRGMDTDFILRRFRHERQILANLSHPNIAQLFDGGATDDGLPYYVMEYVAGQPIDQYCDDHRLTVDQRLKLFETVCSAVQYAHQNLVVHLDIKPSNILVKADGTPKLLDFGIARLLDPNSPQQTLANGSQQTSTGSQQTSTGFQQTLYATGLAPRLLTPGYGSPEQFRGQPVTTASDIYSLGVLLYELLCGCRPFDLRNRTVEEISQVICEELPRRPSTRASAARDHAEQDETVASATELAARRLTSAEKLRRRLTGDLDNIALKAMQKEPQRRYRSVEQLSEDLERHLGGQPVSAQPDSVLYRARKFCERHRTGVLAGLLVALSLLCGIVGTAWQAHIARVERQRAERRFNDVRALANSLLFDLYDSIRDLPGSTPARKLLVDRALVYLDSLSREAAGDRGLQQELANAYEKVGDVQGNPYYANLGNTAGAIASYRKAQAIYESLLADDPHNNTLQQGLQSNYMSLGWTVESTQDFPLALRYLRQALAVAQGLTPPGPRVSDRMAGAMYGIANILAVTGDPNGALENYRKAAEIRSAAIPGASPAGSAALRTHLAADYTGIAKVLATQGNTSAAIESQQKATLLLEQLSQADPLNATLRDFLADSYAYLGSDLKDKGELEPARQQTDRAIAIYTSLAAADPANALVRTRLADAYLTLGNILLREKRPGQAIDSLRQALGLFPRASPGTASNTYESEDTAEAYALLGEAYQQQATDRRTPLSARVGAWQAARSSYQQSLELLKALQKSQPTSTSIRSKILELQQRIPACDQALIQLNARLGTD